MHVIWYVVMYVVYTIVLTSLEIVRTFYIEVRNIKNISN